MDYNLSKRDIYLQMEGLEDACRLIYGELKHTREKLKAVEAELEQVKSERESERAEKLEALERIRRLTGLEDVEMQEFLHKEEQV